MIAPAKQIVDQSLILPQHVAIIMDGNGRWAKTRGQPRVFGHRKGARSVRAIVRLSRSLGIKNLTLFAMSTENLSRPPDEVGALFTLLRRYMQQEVSEMCEKEIRFRIIGNKDVLPREVNALARDVEISTKNGNEMNLTIAVAYGGREDLLAGIENLAHAGLPITAENLERHLWSAHLPPVDLLIRTGGERRISNFLLWHLAYAELYFTDTRWPDFGEAQYSRSLQEFNRRQRRFGQVVDP